MSPLCNTLGCLEHPQTPLFSINLKSYLSGSTWQCRLAVALVKLQSNGVWSIPGFYGCGDHTLGRVILCIWIKIILRRRHIRISGYFPRFPHSSELLVCPTPSNLFHAKNFVSKTRRASSWKEFKVLHYQRCTLRCHLDHSDVVAIDFVCNFVMCKKKVEEKTQMNIDGIYAERMAFYGLSSNHLILGIAHVLYVTCLRNEFACLNEKRVALGTYLMSLSPPKLILVLMENILSGSILLYISPGNCMASEDEMKGKFPFLVWTKHTSTLPPALL